MTIEFDNELQKLEELASQLDSVSIDEKSIDEDVEEKREFSEERRMELAEEGMALPDGSYPIVNRGDLENAIQAYGRAKDKEAAKRHIMKRARELDAEDMIPENWTEKSDADDDIEEKAQAIMSMMKKPKKEEESVFMTDIRFKEMEENGELVTDEQYDTMSDEEKAMYERVNVMNEDSKEGMGMRWRLREMMDGKSMHPMKKMDKKPKGPASVFLTSMKFKEMMESGDMMDEESYDGLDDDDKKGYEMVDVYDEKTKKGWGMHWRRRMPMEREQEVKKNDKKSDSDDVETKSEEGMLCGFQRKSVSEPCAFCRGGCAPEAGLPGLADIESQVKSLHSDSTIIGSGYSDINDIYVVDVKHADGSAIEMFFSSEGKSLGWLALDPEMISESEEMDIISEKDAMDAALKVVPGKVVSVMADIFDDFETYNVEIDGDDKKSYDVYVSVKGEVLAYDVYEVDSDSHDIPEDEEIKALEAELNIKRMYSREQREDMAERGDALPDGSFPIADKADLENAITALPRAKDRDAAKAHIMKRAKELDAEDMIPTDWMGGMDEEAEETDEEMSSEKSALDIAADLKEFVELLAEIED